ncbi:MAG TPA: type II toxin-antitoxin system RelE/ParE family toxin [Actinomycetota bacterium]
MSDRYTLRIAPTARRALEHRLPLKIATAAWEFLDGPLRENPQRVDHPLRAPFVGDWSARRGTYRVRYRIAEDERVVEVLDIAGRSDAYDPTRR